MCTTALSCVHGGMLVVSKAVLHTPVTSGQKDQCSTPPMILKSSGVIAHGDTHFHDALPGRFGGVTSVFSGNATSSSAVKEELNFACKLGIWSLCYVWKMQLTLYRFTVLSPHWKNEFAENLQVNLLIGLN